MSDARKYTIRPVFVVTAHSESNATRLLADLLLSNGVKDTLAVAVLGYRPLWRARRSAHGRGVRPAPHHGQRLRRPPRLPGRVGPPMSEYEQRLRAALARAYTPEGVLITMHSRLLLGGKPRTWRQYLADGEGDVVLDWAESLTGMVAT